jgi:WhiB family transcriptional regulator, redox-sensing transcriptional regulator
MTDWRERAACRELGPELFFPGIGVTAKAGKKVCRRCPVTEECLNYAVSTDTRDGIWGGILLAPSRHPSQRTGESQ